MTQFVWCVDAEAAAQFEAWSTAARQVPRQIQENTSNDNNNTISSSNNNRNIGSKLTPTVKI